ncbi:MAG TPA: type II toxin-antitoxin system RelE/ParE family toxin [Prolixibacteraceae bacterium]|nr:type II toxin-antitoxin system RelE/ParE family toxin [Prolixibacteraceae bacterium]
MKKYRLIISDFAESDLKTAADWYASQKEGLDLDFIQEIEKTIQRIQDNPRLFAVVIKQIRMSIVKRFPYGIYFYVTGNIINVFAVSHFSRNPKVIRKRISPIIKK